MQEGVVKLLQRHEEEGEERSGEEGGRAESMMIRTRGMRREGLHEENVRFMSQFNNKLLTTYDPFFNHMSGSHQSQAVWEKHDRFLHDFTIKNPLSQEVDFNLDKTFCINTHPLETLSVQKLGFLRYVHDIHNFRSDMVYVIMAPLREAGGNLEADHLYSILTSILI
eukprot:scaffold3088_cov169-Ochromonas_danica.AAC.2